MTEQYAIHILRDIDAPNPFEEWDSVPPILTVSPAYAGYQVDKYGLSVKCPDIPEEVVRKHWRRMVEFIYDRGAIEWGDLLQFAREEMHNRYYPLWQGLADAFAESVNDMNISDRLESLAEVYRWMGMPAYVGSTSGYSQGDYAEVLVVWTKEWMDEMDIDLTELTPAQIGEDQEGTVELYGAWAWGDVYGWAITRSTEELTRRWVQDTGCYAVGETLGGKVLCFYWNPQAMPDDIIESCGGHYGADNEESGLLPEARAMVELLQERDQHEAEEQAHWEARDVMTEED